MLESLKRILDRLSNFDLSSWLNSITISGYKVGLDTAQKDLEEEYPSEPDMEAIVRIGMRAHALSEKAIARAKGGMAHNADKLYQEMDAAIKAGMSEKEALFQIQGRVRGLFTDSYQEWELERLVRDQFLVATKEGRRAGWQDGGMKYRQWKIHRDNKTAADSKRMEGQITEIDKPYTDSLTGEKYMLPHMRPNDRCFEVGLWELPEDTVERDGLIYAKTSEPDFLKGGKGSGIRGHTTWKRGSGAQKRRWNIDAEEIEWGPSNLVNTDNKDLRPRIRLMSPQEYIDRMGPENRDRVVTARYSLEQKKRGYKGVMTYPFMPYKIEALKEAIEMGNTIERVSLEYNEEGEVENQEGFHRALIARAMGIKQIPVEVVREGKDKELPKKYKRMHWKDENQMIELLKEAKILPPIFEKGGPGSGIKGHTTYRPESKIIKDYKYFLEGLDGERLKQEAENITKETNYGFSKDIDTWYYGDMKNLTELATNVFGLDSGNTRGLHQTKEFGVIKDRKIRERLTVATYLITQEYCRRKYSSRFFGEIQDPLKTIKVYRGVDGRTYREFRDFPIGTKVDIDSYNVSSWSESKETATKFATGQYGGFSGFKHQGEGVVLEMEIPVKQVLLHHAMNSPGIGSIQEITVMGELPKVTLIGKYTMEDVLIEEERQATLAAEEISRTVEEEAKKEELEMLDEELELQGKQRLFS